MQTMSHLLRTQGFHATGIQQVLKESGIPKGSLYYHFPQGKVELAVDSVENSRDILTQLLTEIVDSAQDPVDAIRIFCNFYIEELKRGNFTLGCPIATITLEAAPTNDQIQVACKASFKKLSSMFIDILLEKGVNHDQASRLATIALASIEGALILCKAQRNTQSLVIIRDNLMAQVSAVLSGNQ